MESPEQEQDRQKRLNALRALAQQGGALPQQDPSPAPPSASTPSSSPTSPTTSHAPATVRIPLRPERQRANRRWPWLLLGALLAVVIVVGGIAAYTVTRRPAAPTIANTLTIDLAAAHLACPTQLEWSPDGTRVAVSLYASNCVNGGAPENARVVIFDARTGQLLRELNPQAALTQAGVVYPGGDYAWSPDGSMLVFAVGYSPSEAPGYKAGMLLMPVNGGAAKFIQGPQTTENSTNTYIIWDLRAATARLQTAGLPAALSYRWTADGSIIPEQSFPAGDASAPLTGSPVQRPGTAGFSYWQPGTLLPILKISPNGGVDVSTAPLAVAYWSETSHWSPDGRYLAIPVSQVGRLRSAADQPFDATTCQYSLLHDQCDAQPLPLPDAAFKKLVDEVAQPAPSAQMNGVPVAWRPDGKLLATLLPGQGFDVTAGQLQVTLYDTKTGAVVAALKAKRTNPNQSYGSQGEPVLHWSPTGKQLAVFDFGSNTVTIWGGSALPA